MSLESRLAEGPLSLGEVLHYSVGLAKELRKIHGRGRVHGFLHPCGIAIAGDQVRLSPTGPAAVSPYFSPEQVAGSDLDARSDIFSFGAILYEMLSGRRAFSATTRAALRMEIATREPEPLGGIPAPVARLVERCLEKKSERRLQRIGILLAELKLQEILAEGAPMEETPAPPPLHVARAPIENRAAGEELVCPACGSRDVTASEPDGFSESLLVRLGMRIGRCYRCYHRFGRLAGFYVKSRRGCPR
jgi:serine/threonine protein kinase